MNAVTDLFYAFWAQISSWHLIGRAALVIGIIMIVIWPIGIRILKGFFILLLTALNFILKLIYHLITDFMLSRIKKENYAIKQNLFSSKFENLSQKIDKRKEKIYLNIKKVHFARMIFIYAVVIFLIALPTITSDFINDEYIKYFSYMKNAYIEFETPLLKNAEVYKPIIKNDSLYEYSTEDVGNL